uniref:Uncharacterized protein n=1 Tax=Ackermannviridae sp. ctaCq7 TaxID=2827294 RepID=A0A8S5R6B6_9CAUD|nr:MAG TPA: hypothetical protein [Ackermannviridae sp. ctaCq7]
MGVFNRAKALWVVLCSLFLYIYYIEYFSEHTENTRVELCEKYHYLTKKSYY